eukprot:maker-scaffold836_size90567-snap-gene-0.18 protein:Tk11224 transcript:maker-scaffold836_size90567-snap-gene-0.18-mRNA-1 annotation:"hypothetical protein DAPPUDRAFT_309169"
MAGRVRLVLACLTVIVAGVSGKRLKDRIYTPLITHGFCFRRTNGTHQFGCSSDFSGNVGVVHLIQTPADLAWMLSQGPHWPYMAVMTPRMFSGPVVHQLKDSGKIAGIVLLLGDTFAQDRPEAFSDDGKCPNQMSSLYYNTEAQCQAEVGPWNPSGSNLLLESFDFPIFLTRHENTTRFLVEECFEQFNRPDEAGQPRDWPLCAVELDAHMYSAVSTETCIRRSNIMSTLNPVKFCDELGDFSYFGFLREQNASLEAEDASQSVIAVTARLDSITLFDLNEFGSDSPITAIVALLETARLLASSPPDFQGEVTNILFAFLYGEAFDYMASERLLYDIVEGQFPLELDPDTYPDGQKPLFHLADLDHIIEVGQLANQNSGERLFAHTDTQFRRDDLVDDLVNFANQNQLRLRGLPPASSQTFLKANRTIPAIQISDFDAQYTNAFYHSLYDTPKANMDYDHAEGEEQAVVQHIGRVASTLAGYLFEKATGNPSTTRIPTFKANTTLVNELLYCYLQQPNCPLFNAVSNAETPPFYDAFPLDPFPQYVGVDIKTQFHGIFTRNLLSYLTGEVVPELTNKVEECHSPANQSIYEYIFLKGESAPESWTEDTPCNASLMCGYCYKISTFRKESKSPAFVIEGYNFSSLQYSSWAESVWKSVNARIFLKASPGLDAGYFSIGVIVFLLSLALAFFAERNASKIFLDEPRTGSAESSATTVSSTAAAANRAIAL